MNFVFSTYVLVVHHNRLFIASWHHANRYSPPDYHHVLHHGTSQKVIYTEVNAVTTAACVSEKRISTMLTKEQFQAKIQARLARTEEHIENFKSQIASAGDSASDEAREALAKAEELCQLGKARYDEIAAASEEQFEEMRDTAAANWQGLSHQMDTGWKSMRERFTNYFS